MPVALQTYSFLDVQASIAGPGGSFPIGSTAGAAKEGISIEMLEPKDTLLVGADGQAMHSMHGGQAGTITVRLLKTSPTNYQLMQLYNVQKGFSGIWGQNTISIVDMARGDNITAQGAAFGRAPNISYAESGDVLAWAFACAWIEEQLGGLIGTGPSGIGPGFGVTIGGQVTFGNGGFGGTIGGGVNFGPGGISGSIGGGITF